MAKEGRVLFESSKLLYTLQGVRLDRNAELSVRVAFSAESHILKLELIHEHDLGNPSADNCFYYLAEITPAVFTQIKQDQSLRVDFKNFSLQLVSLLEKCTQGDSSGFRLGISPVDEDVSMLRLDVLEITTFRELAHVTLQLTRATETQARLFLFSRLKAQLARADELDTAMLQLTKQEQNRLNLLASKDEEIRTLRANSDKIIAALEQQCAELQTTIQAKDEEIGELQLCKSQLNTEMHQTNARVKQLEQEVSSANDANQALEQNLHEVKRALESEQASAISRETQIMDLNKQLEHSRLSSGEHDSLQSQLNRSNQEYDSLKESVSTKNKVIKEQDRVVTSLEQDLQALKQRTRELEQDLAAEHARAQEYAQLVDKLKQTLEHNQVVLEENQTLISHLQNQHRSF